MSIASALEAAALLAVEAGGLHFRCGRVSTADIAEAGGTFLLAMRAPREGEPDTDDAPTDKELIQRLKFQDALVCAGVQQVSQDGATWEDLKVVPPGAPTGNGRVRVSSLPPGTAPVLAAAILTHSTDGGAATERLKSFLGERGDSRGAGRRRP